MFHRSQSTLIFLVAFFVALAVAAPGRRTEPTITTTVTHTVTAPASQGTAPTGQCSTGPVQCCNSVQKAGDAKNLKPDAITGIFGGLLSGLLIGGLLASVLADVSANVPVGLNCSPVLGVLTSTSCSAQAVCCQNNNFNGLVNVGCSPINIGL